jgi:surface antigen
MAAINGTGNGYPQGQCTYYADSRYHELTGYYVPWSGNARDWATQALAYGWTVSSTPIVPSIVCLQAGIQGADGTYGHVGVVESIGKGTVIASNQNWGPYPANVTDVTFSVGPGVSFIYAVGPNGKAAGNSSTSFTTAITNIVTGQGGSKTPTIAPNADVTQFLWYLDQLLLITNPFSTNAATDNISFAGASFSFTDPVAWTEDVLGNVFDDFVALTVRTIFLIIGTVIILKVISNFIDFGAISDTVQSGVQTLAMGAVLA